MNQEKVELQESLEEVKEAKESIPIITYEDDNELTDQEDQIEDEDKFNELSYKDFKNLKRNRYHKIKDKFKQSFILHNIKQNKVIELNAATPYHACKLINWNPNQVKIITLDEEDEN